MNCLKTKLRHLKLLWRYLVIVLCFVLFPSGVFGAYTLNFDDCSISESAGDCYNGNVGDYTFSGYAVDIVDTEYFSSPYSGYFTNYPHINSTDTGFQSIQFKIKIPTTGGTVNLVNKTKGGSLYFKNANKKVYLGQSNNLEVKELGDYVVDTWYSAGISFDESTDTTTGNFNYVSDSVSGVDTFTESTVYYYFTGGNYFDDIVLFGSSTTGTSLEIINPTEGYAYANVQPMPFMFEYQNDSNLYDRVWIQIDQMHTPQYSLSPLSYNIAITTATTTGMVFSSLAQGSYRVQGFLYNSITDSISSSTGYVNFTVSTSTVPVGTIPSYTDQDFNELTKNPIWSTSSVNTVLEDMLNCSTGNWWDKLSCNVGKAIISIPEYMMKGYKKTVDGFLFVVKSVFPFNLPIAFLSAWNSSTDILPSGLTFINDTVDSSGNVYLSLPSEWSSSSTVPIFGTIAFSNFTTANGFFAFIKALSPVIMWGMFIFSLWGLASDVLRDIIGIKTGKNID